MRRKTCCGVLFFISWWDSKKTNYACICYGNPWVWARLDFDGLSNRATFDNYFDMDCDVENVFYSNLSTILQSYRVIFSSLLMRYSKLPHYQTTTAIFCLPMIMMYSIPAQCCSSCMVSKHKLSKVAEIINNNDCQNCRQSEPADFKVFLELCYQYEKFCFLSDHLLN